VGLALTIAHAMGTDVLGGVGRARRDRHGDRAARRSEREQWRSQRSSWTAQGVDREQTPPEQGRTQAAQEPDSQAGPTAMSKVHRADAGAKSLTVFGWILIAFGIMDLISKGLSGNLWNLLTFAAVTLGGGAMLFSAAAGRKKEARFKRCLNVTGTSGLVDMNHVSETMGIDLGQTDKLLSEMIDRGYYGSKVYLDHQRKLLVIDPQDMRDVYRAEDEAKKTKAESEAKAGETEYDRIIKEIRQADIDIEDEAMSEKIRRMQTITASIFEEVKEHPEKKPQIQRFMDYYLPTTLKLLSSYARIEAQGVSGDNMAKAKADIERIADTLVQGYEKQLDTLYQSEAVDIAGDVSVIENMMRRDGLAGGNDFGKAMGGH
jgi:5-bromo-4-chloroindolyl phosphate hydrolysis protein.